MVSSLLIATRNRGKLTEIVELLAGLPLTIVGLEAFPHIGEATESGQTFEENALIKARYYHDRTGWMTVADDSGLVVDALGGEPGVHSARYGTNDAERRARLLQALCHVPPEHRTARFVCVVALVAPGVEKTFRGEVAGLIRTTPAGTGGFGYDPLFEYPPLGKTFAELSRAEKSAVSHRGRAFARLREFLQHGLRSADSPD